MKKLVVVKQKNDVIDLSQITNETILGFRGSFYSGFITQSPNGQYFCSGRNHDNDGCWVENSKQNAVKKLTDRDCEVFAFDTLKELYQWLAED